MPRVEMTRRQQMVVDLLSKGHIFKTAADVLNISARTVEAHAANARDINECKTVAQLVGRYTVAVAEGSLIVRTASKKETHRESANQKIRRH